jgi:hypothetical protein
MLALHDDSQIYGTFRAGGWFTLPNGDKASPAVAGWTGENGLQLSAVVAADPVPSGKISTGQTAQLVGGVPKWVHSLEDIPPVGAAPGGKALEDRRLDEKKSTIKTLINDGKTDEALTLIMEIL